MIATEVFGLMNGFSDHMHRIHKMRELGAEIRGIGTKCGDCQHWMKSSSCPREHNVNGYTRGPSSGDFKCGKFVETKAAADRRETLTLELAAIQEQQP